MLDPVVFRNACRLFNFYPTADMFASRSHGQLDPYFTADPADKLVLGCNSFLFSWWNEDPYCNPPPLLPNAPRH